MGHWYCWQKNITLLKKRNAFLIKIYKWYVNGKNNLNWPKYQSWYLFLDRILSTNTLLYDCITSGSITLSVFYSLKLFSCLCTQIKQRGQSALEDLPSTRSLNTGLLTGALAPSIGSKGEAPFPTICKRSSVTYLLCSYSPFQPILTASHAKTIN